MKVISYPELESMDVDSTTAAAAIILLILLLLLPGILNHSQKPTRNSDSSTETHKNLSFLSYFAPLKLGSQH